VRELRSTPLVTLGVVSYNRLQYLRSLIASARECIRYPRLEWIVVDGASVEPGLREYLDSLDFLDRLVVEECTHAEAMNTIVELAHGEFLMLVPEDIQFTARGNWLADMVEIAARRRVGHVTFDAQRRLTIRRRFTDRRIAIRRRELPLRAPGRGYRLLVSSSGARFLGHGHTLSAVIASGIMSFGRTEIWRTLGPWRTNRELETADDSSLGAESDMELRFLASGLRLEGYMMQVPVAADVVTDPRGTKARIRKGKRRYGRYAPPPEPPFYYEIADVEELRARFGHVEPAPGFEDVVVPRGFDLPLDAHGNLLKTSVISETEPYELVG
jgi:glycosyltransferase involved in cell wall biosynthesis